MSNCDSWDSLRKRCAISGAKACKGDIIGGECVVSPVAELMEGRLFGIPALRWKLKQEGVEQYIAGVEKYIIKELQEQRFMCEAMGEEEYEKRRYPRETLEDILRFFEGQLKPIRKK